MTDGKRYFFVGIGGSGMMPLAMILAGRGARVAGSDRSLDAGRVPAKFDALRALGVELFPQDGSGITSPEQIVVASAAVEDSVPDIAQAKALGCERMTRAQLNAELFNESLTSVGVAGTSGKSTVTGMIACILHALGKSPTVMNGAVMRNFVSQERPFASALIGDEDIYVSEIDESDGSIALYNPEIAVLNNISRDHKELDELRLLFGDFHRRSKWVIVNTDDKEAVALIASRSPETVLGYSLHGNADLNASNISEEPFAVSFDLVHVGVNLGRVRLQVPGRHNVANALAAIRACFIAAPASQADLIGPIERYTGIARRFERVGEAAGVTVIDDFGHNPDKIAATLATLRAFPGRLLILFQPHGYGPLKQLRGELAEAFATGLAEHDLLVLPDPAYFGGTVAREVGSGELAADIRALGRYARHVAERSKAADLLVREARTGDRIIVMGARDDTLGVLAREMLDGLARRG
jgi:UDP-N-acetylmuramate--alanine ligase